MALAESLSRVGAGALRIVHQRLELAALDVEEELLRIVQLLAGVLLVALLGTLAVGALAALIVVAFWDTARLAALASVAVLLAAATAFVAGRVGQALAAKPAFLSTTLAVLAQDRAALAQEERP